MIHGASERVDGDSLYDAGPAVVEED